MVFDKIKKVIGSSDEKYEVLFHKYSQIKSENQQLKKKHILDMEEYKIKLNRSIANHLIVLYEGIEQAKNDSFKVHATSKELQQLMIDINKIQKDVKDSMKEYSLEEIESKERFYDPELHEVASYESAKGMNKGLILKTVKKGFKFRGDIIKKPRVVVTK